MTTERPPGDLPPAPWAPEPPRAALAVGGLARAITLLLAAACVTALSLGAMSWWHAGVVDGALDSDGVNNTTLDSADIALLVVGLVDSLVFLATAVVFIVWFWRVIKNAQLIERATMRSTGSAVTKRSAPAAGWSIGAWFIPVANLVLPAYFLTKVDRLSGAGTTSESGRSESGQSESGQLASGAGPTIVWWAVLWGAANLLSRVLWRTEPQELEAIMVADRREIWAQLLFVAAAVLAIRMVQAITQRQQAALATVAR